MGTVLSLVMLGALVMIAGAGVLWRRTGERKRPLLMLLLAAIMLANIAIWSVPDASGEAPATRELR